jgi:O-antigen/teichoic acid export membrane protein
MPNPEKHRPAPIRLLHATKKPLLGTFWTGTSLGATKALVFVATVLLARALPSEDFGRFVILSSLSVVLIPAMDAGFGSLVFRAASRQPGDRGLSLVKTAGRSRWLLWLAVLVLLAGSTVAVKGARTGIEMALVVLAAAAQAQLNAATGDLQGRARFANAAWVRASSGLVSLAGAVGVFLLSQSALAALASFAFARVIPALVVTALSWTREQVDRPEDIRWRRALPLAMLAILQVAYVRSDILVMALFNVSGESVATYGVVYRWVMAAQLIPAALSIVVFPSLARRTANSSRNYMLVIQAGMIFVSMFAALTAWQSDIVFSLFGGDYSALSLQALPLVMTLLPLSVSLVAVDALVAQKQERSLVTVGAIGFVTNVGLNFVLVPVAGMRGAMIATLCGESAVAISSMILAGRAGFPVLAKPLALVSGAAVISTLATIAAASAEVRRTDIMIAAAAAAAAALVCVIPTLKYLWRRRTLEQPAAAAPVAPAIAAAGLSSSAEALQPPRAE